MFDKLSKYHAYHMRSRARVELSVGKSSCAALSELQIALNIQLSAVDKPLDRSLSFVDGFAPFQYNGSISCLGKRKSCKESCRSQTDYHRTLGQRRQLTWKQLGYFSLRWRINRRSLSLCNILALADKFYRKRHDVFYLPFISTVYRLLYKFISANIIIAHSHELG